MNSEPCTTIHATAVRLAAAAVPFGGPEEGAVLLLGESGTGKSDVALRLIAAGARLIADDQSVLILCAGRLFARAPETIAGLMEVRGVGLVRLDHAEAAPVVLAVQLDRVWACERLAEPRYFHIPGLTEAPPVPEIVLAPFEASTPAKIAAAVAAAARGTLFAEIP